MSEVFPNFKDNQGECECGCGAYGTLKKPWRSNGKRCVARKCPCRQCLGKTSRKKGDDKARIARKALGISGANTRHEELWGGQVRSEMKAGAQVKPAVTAFTRMEAQSEAQRPFGDNRPFVGVAMPDGSNDGVFMCRLSALPEVIAAIAEQWGAAS